jgi:hypothetical protein
MRHSKYTKLLFDIIRTRWTNEYPEYFKCCTAMGEERKQVQDNCYKYYLRVINNIDGLHNHHKYNLDTIKGYKELIDEATNCVDIRLWTLENIPS